MPAVLLFFTILLAFPAPALCGQDHDDYQPPHAHCESLVALEFSGSHKVCHVDDLYLGRVEWLPVDVELVGADAFQADKHRRIQEARATGDRDRVVAVVAGIREEATKRERGVLDRLDETSCRIRFDYPMLLGFSCEVTRTGLEALAAMDEVAHIHALDRCREETVQGRTVLRAPAVNSRGFTGRGIGLAILDSGVEYSHVCLGWHAGFPNSKVVAGRYVVPRSVQGRNKGNMIRDLSGHGTACAVIAAGEKLSFFKKLALARSDDYDGGVAPEAGVYAVQLYRDNGTYRFDEIIRGLQWCANPANHDPAYPLLVANVSLGGGCHEGVADVEQHNFFLAVDDCLDMGITVFASSGNQGYAGAVSLPAALSNVIGVGAVYDSLSDQQTYTVVDGRCVPPGTISDKGLSCACTDRDVRPGRVCCFTNLHSTMTELFAPAALACTAGVAEDELITNFGGTSAASAYAAGAAAVLQQAALEKTGRYLSPRKLRDLMHRTGRRPEYPRRPHEPVLQGVLVDVERAVTSLGP